MNELSDKELLELAAKAAGIDYIEIVLKINDVMKKRGDKPCWDPLTDDGDEARLECTLCLTVVWGSTSVIVGNIQEFFIDHSNKQIARRRAGVRAAAELGKQI